MLIPFIVAVALLAVDLVSKYWVCAYTRSGDTITVIRNVLSFTYSENRGASFGMMGDHPVLLLVLTTVFTIGLICFCVFKRRSMHPLESYAFWLIISGAIGNLFDRFAFGYVRDFIDYEFISAILGRDFAICNFADLVLIVGTVMLLVYVIFFYGKERFPEAAPVAEPASMDAPDTDSESGEIEKVDAQPALSADVSSADTPSAEPPRPDVGQTVEPSDDSPTDTASES